MPATTLGDAAQRACLDHVNRAVRRSALLGIPASTLLVLILGGSVRFGAGVAFVVCVSAADIFTFIVTSRHLRRRARGALAIRSSSSLVGVALVGGAWASLATFAMPIGIELRAIYLLFVCGCSATYVVGTAAKRSYYYASQVPMMSIVAIAFLTSPDSTTRLLGLAVPMYFVVMTMLFQQVHTLFIRELFLRQSNEEAGERLRAVNAALVEQARTDALTGLLNREGFMHRLRHALTEQQAVHGCVGVLYLDIDRFKTVNDALGHTAGDELLVDAAVRVRALFGRREVLARLGGDEFAVLLPDLKSEHEAIEVAHRVRRAFEKAANIRGRRIHMSASVGVVTNEGVNDTAELLVSLADHAQYRAKQAGRNRVHVCDATLRLELERWIDDEDELRLAVARREFVAFFQPEVDLRSGEVVGAEALARWVHRDRGVLEARHFVSLAEDTGLVLSIDDVVVSNAIAARAELARQGVSEDFRIWCNVSPKELTRSRPTERLLSLLQREGCPPHLIGIEITETAVLPDVEVAARELAAAREAGLQVALDDFGTGHSSLTLLRSLPIDKLKIDRSFVRDITSNARDAAIVRRVLGLANDLGIDVAVEGVETQAQADLLADFGCVRAQGYLWSRAVPLEVLSASLHDQACVQKVASLSA